MSDTSKPHNPPADPRLPRVLMVGPLPPPVGGMASVVENLRAALSGQVELRVLNTAKTTALDRTFWQGAVAQLRLFSRLAWSCVAWQPDLVHIHTCSWLTFWRNGADMLLARLLGRRVVLHIHGAQFHRFLGGLSPMHAWLARQVLGLAQRVVVLGADWKALLDDWTDPRRVVIVANGVPLPGTPVGRTHRRGELRVVCLANYEQRKGQADLLRAAANLKDSGSNGQAPAIRIDLLGFEAEPGQRQVLLDLAARLGLAEQVDIPGPVTGAALAARLQAATCFCLPSYDEGLPMSMLEAMALGLPVVVTAVGAIPDAVVDGSEGLIYTPGDIDALSHHLRTLRDDPTRAAALGQAGQRRLVQCFSLERSANSLLILYREMLA